MLRRVFLAFAFALPLLLASASAWAGSYLNRAAILLEASRAERDMALPNYNDKELIRLVQEIAEARTRSARATQVPKAVASAHPHLMLVLENCERAYSAALDGQHDKFVDHILRARAEDKTYRALLSKLGYSLPDQH
jgi:hypothetical protein